jgi:AraC-like DNA-binding protein
MAVFAPVLSYLWESAKDYGLDPAELFKEAGVDPRLRLDINARVSADQYDRLILAEKQKSHDDAFVFHLVEHIHPSYLGPMGYAWMTSASLRQAFQRMSRYARMLADEAFLRLEDHDDGLHILVLSQEEDFRDPDLREQLRLANAVKLCRMNCGDSFKPTRIHFKQAEPHQPAAYYSYFRCELLFNSESSVLVIDADIADQQLPGANAQLETLLEQQLIDYVARLDKQDTAGRTKSVIFNLLPSGRVSIEEIAAKLGMSVRTLRRRLKDSGTSFKDLLAETRRELGERYIKDSSMSLTEVAFMLGFSDSSSFSRAYRKWTGQSPSNYRSSHKGAAGDPPTLVG